MSKRQGIPICCSLKLVAYSEANFFMKAHTCYDLIFGKIKILTCHKSVELFLVSQDGSVVHDQLS